MALRGEQLARGAALAGVTVDEAKTDRLSNIRAAAALLSEYADELELERSDLGAWAPVAAIYSGIQVEDFDAQASYIHDYVYTHLREGVVIQDLAGIPVAQLNAVDVVPDFAPVSDAAEFQFYMPAAGTKIVDAWWVAGTNRSDKAPFVIFNASGTKLGTVNADQTKNGGKWVQLGTFNFTKGWNKVVLSRWTGEGKVVIADAVRIR